MKKLFLPAILIVAIGLIIGIPLLIKVVVACESQYGTCSPDIESSLKQFDNKNIRLAQKGIKNTLTSNPSVSDYSIQFKLPNTLLVNIIIKKPDFAVMDLGTNTTWLLDDSGEVLSSSEGSLLPTVKTTTNLQKFQKVDEKTLFALNLMKGIYAMYQVQNGEVKDDTLVVELPPRYTVTFPLEGDVQILLGEVRLVYSKLQSDEATNVYSQIDLRFKNPVLR